MIAAVKFFSLKKIAGVCLLCFLGYEVCKITYNLFFDKASQYSDLSLISFNFQPNSDSINKKNKNYFHKNNMNEKNITASDIYKSIDFAYRPYSQIDKKKLNNHSIYETIKDHTFKLVMPCQSGTGWILDYAISNANQYPTKWYIATNMHVIDKFRFLDNPYNVQLPIDLNTKFVVKKENDLKKPTLGSVIYQYLDQSINNNYITCEDSLLKNKSNLKLFREVNSDEKILQDYAELNDAEMFHDVANNMFYSTTIHKPKLFYAAINFLGPRYKSNVFGQYSDHFYHKDFAILEIEFPSEKHARLMTNNYYDKYSETNIPPNKQPLKINYFDKELMEKYEPQTLINNQDIFYAGGYPGWYPGNQFGNFGNLNFEINSAQRTNTNQFTESKLTYFPKNSNLNYANLKNHYDEVIKGHLSTDTFDKFDNTSKLKWEEKLLHGWGYNYLINNMFLESGASGSMTIDKNGNLLGLYRIHNSVLNYGWIEPIRSNWVVHDNKVILPGYDLIQGTGGQSISYFSQLNKYYPRTTTHLRKLKELNLN